MPENWVALVFLCAVANALPGVFLLRAFFSRLYVSHFLFNLARSSAVLPLGLFLYSARAGFWKFHSFQLLFSTLRAGTREERAFCCVTLFVICHFHRYSNIYFKMNFLAA